MKKKIRLVFIIGCLAMGGAEHMVYELVNNIDKEKFEITVLCTFKKKDTPLERMVEDVCAVQYLSEEGHIGVRSVVRVMSSLTKLKPDIVHAHMGGAGYAAPWSILNRKPLVITIHTKPEKAFSNKIGFLVKAALKLSKTKLVAVSQDNLEKVRRFYQIDDRKSDFVNNGVDIARFFRKKHDLFTLINVARHDENKNQAALIRCFNKFHKENEDTRLLLLGDGELHQKLISLVNELGLSRAVEFTGNVCNTEDYYAASDVYVQCSHREAMPLSVLEAMAAGLPVVSTDVGGLRDVVRDNGYLISDNDEDALYQAILKIYKQDAAQTDMMCEASKRIVQEYSSQGMARKYEKIYQEML